jgi:hypothetical protein
MSYFAARFMCADVVAEKPVICFIEVDGPAMDSRSLPIEYQVMAFQRGYIEIPLLPSWKGSR